MATLQSLKRVCGTKTIKGTKAVARFCIKGEFNGWPQTKEELGGSAQGDSKVLDEPFDFSTAPPGFGYWREIDILVDTGQLKMLIEGEVAGLEFKNGLDFFIQGSGAAQLEFGDLMIQYSGCLIWNIPDKNGNEYILGDLENPCFVESGEGGTGGDKNGMQYSIYSKTGLTPMIYDADTHGIDLTPNP